MRAHLDHGEAPLRTQLAQPEKLAPKLEDAPVRYNPAHVACYAETLMRIYALRMAL